MPSVPRRATSPSSPTAESSRPRIRTRRSIPSLAAAAAAQRRAGAASTPAFARSYRPPARVALRPNGTTHSKGVTHAPPLLCVKRKLFNSTVRRLLSSGCWSRSRCHACGDRGGERTHDGRRELPPLDPELHPLSRLYGTRRVRRFAHRDDVLRQRRRDRAPGHARPFHRHAHQPGHGEVDSRRREPGRDRRPNRRNDSDDRKGSRRHRSR